MNRALLIRLCLLGLAAGALELACRTGKITRFSMVPPSEMVMTLIEKLGVADNVRIFSLTFGSIAISAIAAITVGFFTGAILHRLPRIRRALDPYLAAYYSIPIFAFYPMFIVIFGVNHIPIILVGYLMAVVAMMTNTLNGLDSIPRVLIKSSLALRLDRIDSTFRITLPATFPYLITGAKFAVAYSCVGVIGAEFIMSDKGLGYEIGFAFNDFDNAGMYALILLVVIAVSLINMVLSSWERCVFRQRGMQ